MPTKLYIGNLSYSVTQEDLQELFGRIGKVESAAVVTDKFTGQSRGFGFVEMTDAAEAAQAIEQLNDQDLKGRRLKIDQARSTERSGGRPGGGRDRERGGAGHGGERGNRW